MNPDSFRLTATRKGVRVLKCAAGWWQIVSPAAHGIPTVHRVFSPTGALEHVARSYRDAVVWLAEQTVNRKPGEAASEQTFDRAEIVANPQLSL